MKILCKIISNIKKYIYTIECTWKLKACFGLQETLKIMIELISKLKNQR